MEGKKVKGKRPIRGKHGESERKDMKREQNIERGE